MDPVLDVCVREPITDGEVSYGPPLAHPIWTPFLCLPIWPFSGPCRGFQSNICIRVSSLTTTQSNLLFFELRLLLLVLLLHYNADWSGPIVGLSGTRVVLEWNQSRTRVGLEFSLFFLEWD